MTLAIDSSTPALAENASGTTCTSNAFSPPAGSLLVVVLANCYGNTITSITDSLATHLTYRKLVNGPLDSNAEIWVADCPSAQTGMTVTATTSATQPANVTGFGVIVMTGAAAAASQTGATNNGSGYSGAPSAAVTTTAAGSQVIGVAAMASVATAPTPATGQTNTFGSQSLVLTSGAGAQWCQTTTSPTATSGTVVTISDTAPTGDHGIVAAEILAASGGGGASATAGDTITLSSSAAVYTAGARSAGDTIAFADAATTGGNSWLASAGDTITLSDSAAGSSTHSGGGSASAADTISLSSTAAAHTAEARTAGDTISISSSASGAGARTRTAGDSIALSSSASGSVTPKTNPALLTAGFFAAL